MAGRAEDAWEHYTKIAPAWIEDQRRHKVEPYVYSQMLAGRDAAVPGEGKNSWLTGTAAWNWLCATQYILGIRPGYDGLTVAPVLPSSLKELNIVRRWRDAVYRIHISNTGKGSISLSVDGKRLTGNKVPYSVGEHCVEVDM